MALINLRNALMAGRRLPYDAEVEYLQSSGTQWIDTGVNTKQSLKIRAVFETDSTISYFAYGVRAGNSTITCASGTNIETGYVRWGESAFADAVPRGLVDITQYSSGVIVNGTSYQYNAAQTVVEQSGYTMVIFAGRNSTTNVTANMVGKFYSCKIWDNGVLVRDFIPVRKGTVGYLYDRVSGKLFGNAGTGDFVLGQDVVQVEYIESHGTEWIDTGVYATENTRVKATLMTISTGNKNWFGGAASGYTGFAINSYSSTQIEYYFGNGGWKRASGTDLVNRVFTLEFSKSSVSIDGVSVATPSYTSFPTQTSPITIFVRYGGTAYINGRVYSFQVYESGDLARKLLPVRVGNEGALIDTLTRRVYRNQGTGAFGYGNDLKYPIPA